MLGWVFKSFKTYSDFGRAWVSCFLCSFSTKAISVSGSAANSKEDAGHEEGQAAFGDELNRTLGSCDASKSNAGELGNRVMPSTKIIKTECRQF